jgi:anti-sigma regulatory factor (Ser/Thr protein kinase)
VKVVTLPASLDERTFDQVARGLEGEAGERRLFDGSHVRWADPYGMIGLLAVGSVAGRSAEKPILRLPEQPDVLSYMARMGFYEHADPVFEIHGQARRSRHDGPSDVLLEITAINSHADVHAIVELVNERGMTILTKQLHYPSREAFQFSVVLSEVCQNIIEHAETSGWVATQRYTWTKRLAGRKVVVIAVMDLGVGFRQSLASAHAAKHGDAGRFTDATALEAAFLHGQTRFHDVGRGQGLQQIRKQVGRWNGRVSIRSGSSRIADVPDWDDSPPLEEHLPFVPGSQIGIILPARVAEGGEAEPARAAKGEVQ